MTSLKQQCYTLSCVLISALFSANSMAKEWLFDVYLDQSKIGEHQFKLSDAGVLTSTAKFNVKVLFINAYQYDHQAVEDVYKRQVLLLAPLASHIPLCALSAILFVVAYNMSELHRFTHMVLTAPKADVAVLLITFLLTVFGDLVIAVNIGVLLACLLFMKRMSEAVVITQQSQETLFQEVADVDFKLPENTVVFGMEGPFFFGAAQHLESALESAHKHADVLVLRLDKVPFIDATGIQALWDLYDACKRHQTRLVLCQARPNVLNKLQLSGITGQMGKENVIDQLQQIRVAE